MKPFLAALALLLLAACASSNKRGEAYVKAHPDLDAETQQRILAGEAVEGMTAEQVIASIGGPGGVRRIAGGTEYWDYASAVLIFKDGILAGWVDKRTLY